MASPLTTVIIPVKDEAPHVVMKLLADLDRYHWPVLLVDDGSQVPVHGADIRFDPPGRGYGASIKAGIDRASTDLVATMDGDGQHSAWDIKRLEDFMVYMSSWMGPDGYHPPLEMVIGDRRLRERGRRYWGRKFLNWTASLFARRFIPDLNSGMRIFRRNTAWGYREILSNGFSFTSSLTLSMLTDGYAVDWLPIKVSPRLQGQTKVRLWRDGWKTLGVICWIGIALRTRRFRAILRRIRGTAA